MGLRKMNEIEMRSRRIRNAKEAIVNYSDDAK
jgi:hypothetical protein